MRLGRGRRRASAGGPSAARRTARAAGSGQRRAAPPRGGRARPGVRGARVCRVMPNCFGDLGNISPGSQPAAQSVRRTRPVSAAQGGGEESSKLPQLVVNYKSHHQ